MKLKYIRLSGFKSFADETKIELEEASTAIVGPNGCGKSNILDAVRWVLGEKSAKGLRGQQMEDLIFLGSTMRKPAGMAEVEICFDNTDRKIQLNSDEILLGRRIYLSSTSEYYINDKRTTRKELEKIFLDTGLGTNSYSIIEQGKISAILQATPQERRLLLDEAAGIGRYKLERKETYQKLKETEQNLLRLQDIFKTKEKEIDKLKQQAEKTKEYFHLKEQLDKHDYFLRYLEIKRLYEKQEKAKILLNQYQEKRSKKLEEVKKLENEKEISYQQSQKLLDEKHIIDRKFHQDLSLESSLKKQKQSLEEEKIERTYKIKDLAKRAREEQERYKATHKKLEEAQQLQLNLENDLNQWQLDIVKIQNLRKNIEISIQESTEKQDTNRVELQNKEKTSTHLLTDLKNVTHDLLIELQNKKKEFQNHENLRNELKEVLFQKLSAMVFLVKKINNKEYKENLEDVLKKDFHNISFVDLESIQTDFQNYDSIAQELRSFFFDPSGSLSQKENIDRKMHKISHRITEIREENHKLQNDRKLFRKKLEENRNQEEKLKLQILDHEVRKESHSESLKHNQNLLKEGKERLEYFQDEEASHKKRIEDLTNKEKNIKNELQSINDNIKKRKQRLESLHPQIDKIQKELESIDIKIQDERENAEEILPKIREQEIAQKEFLVKIQQYEEKLNDDFAMNFSSLEEKCIKLNLEYKVEKEKYQSFFLKIKELGTFNALALEELKKNQKELETLKEQKADIEMARQNIQIALKDLDKKSLKNFQESFTQIQKNFETLFCKLFGGGTAYLKLSEQDNILESGIDIMVQPIGKKNTSIALLSGGEQSLTAIALIFAMYLVKPSPFCFLDEIDAPLDDVNTQRFLEMLHEFAKQTQFLLITHNKLSMSHAQVIFGVTQEEAGVSKLVSVKLRKNKKTEYALV